METNRFAIGPFDGVTAWRHCIMLDLFRKGGLNLWSIAMVSDRICENAGDCGSKCRCSEQSRVLLSGVHNSLQSGTRVIGTKYENQHVISNYIPEVLSRTRR